MYLLHIVTSVALSSISPTLSNRGDRRNLNGIGVRPDNPSYSSRDIGSSGRGVKSKDHSRRDIASHSSRSAAGRPGHILLL